MASTNAEKQWLIVGILTSIIKEVYQHLVKVPCRSNLTKGGQIAELLGA
jgi:hypothetical protein